MTAYILTQNLDRKPEEFKFPENPAQEMADNILAGKRALANYGGWNITVSMKDIKPEDCLFFYRHCPGAVQGSGICAVGRALPEGDPICCEMCKQHYRAQNKDVEFASVGGPGLAAYRAANWERKDGPRTTHINAAWDIVAVPGQGPIPTVLSSSDFWSIVHEKWHGVNFRKPGTPALDHRAAEVWEECQPEGKRSHFNEEWDVVEDQKRGWVFIRRNLKCSLR